MLLNVNAHQYIVDQQEKGFQLTTTHRMLYTSRDHLTLICFNKTIRSNLLILSLCLTSLYCNNFFSTDLLSARLLVMRLISPHPFQPTSTIIFNSDLIWKYGERKFLLDYFDKNWQIVIINDYLSVFIYINDSLIYRSFIKKSK